MRKQSKITSPALANITKLERQQEAHDKMDTQVIGLSEGADGLRIRIQATVMELQRQGRTGSAELLFAAMQKAMLLHKDLEDAWDYVHHAQD